MNPNLEKILGQANKVLNRPTPNHYHGPVHVGVDLGTAYTVLIVLDKDYRPLAGRYQFAQIVRDGLVVDFLGAIDLVKQMKAQVEAQLGFPLVQGATSYPPGVSMAEVKATRNVLLGAGLECSSFVDEPTAANALLQVENGAVVDIGGGTTGVAIVKDGEVIYTADEPTGGTHFSLVIAGSMKIPFEQAEAIKTQRERQRELLSLVRPVMQKVGSIITRHIEPYHVERIFLVGGTSAMLGIAEEVQMMTGIETVVPPHPLFVTPIGIAMQDR